MKQKKSKEKKKNCLLINFLLFGYFSGFIGPTKNWIAVEGSHSTAYATPASLTQTNSTTSDQSDASNIIIASSAPRGPQTFEERNVFAIYVSYYVKVKLTLSGMGGEVSLKLPFILGHLDDEIESDDDKMDNTKLTNYLRSKTPTEIVEEECGQDDIGNTTGDGKHVENDNANRCDIIQLEEKLRFSHLNSNNNNSLADTNHTGDFDDDDDETNQSCQNIITAQIHHVNPQTSTSTTSPTQPPPPSPPPPPKLSTDC